MLYAIFKAYLYYSYEQHLTKSGTGIWYKLENTLPIVYCTFLSVVNIDG